MAQDRRMTRQVVGLLAARLPELNLESMEDPRDERGRVWPLGTLARALLVGLMAGCKSLAEVEVLTRELSPAVRQRLKLRGRTPDTTLRDVVIAMSPTEVGKLLRRSAQVAYRRKALGSDFPLDLVAMDGKATAVEELDNRWAQTHRDREGLGACGLVRTISCVLTSSPTRPVLECVPMGAGGSETGFFRIAFAQLLEHHGAAFEVVTYDAGANSATNAAAVVAAGKHYVFALKDQRRFLLQEAVRVLGDEPPSFASAISEDVLVKGRNVRVIRRLHAAEVPNGYKAMRSVRTVLRVHTQTLDGSGSVLSEENRYFISSLMHTRLSREHWLELVRRHWGVETCHAVLDVSFQEDSRPWVTHSAQGMLVCAIFRRLAYNLLTLWRGRTLRADESRRTPWKTLFRWVSRALEQADHDAFERLRPRVAQAFL
jgi:hypothetical protein